jgi:hypothetical protein
MCIHKDPLPQKYELFTTQSIIYLNTGTSDINYECALAENKL